MTGFWITPIAAAGGPLTQEMLDEAIAQMRKQQDAYYNEPPQPIIYPPRFRRERSTD